MATDDDSPFGDALVDSGEDRQTNTGSTSSSTQHKQLRLEGDYGVRLYTSSMEPDYGSGDIEFVAEFDGVMDFRDDALIGPVSVGESCAEEFRSEAEERLSDVEFHLIQ